MQIHCNGRPLDIPEGLTLAALCQRFDISSDSVVAEVNGTIIDRDQYENFVINDGDAVELIQFVGGG